MKFASVLVLVCMLSVFPFNHEPVWADDDDEEEHEYEEYEEYEDDDDERREYEYDRSYETAPSMNRMEAWDTWSRSARNSLSYEQLPFSDERTAVVQLGEKSIKANVIPFQGQIYVPMQELSNLVGAEFYQYKSINAAEIILKNHHLIVKEGSRVIYENMKKTPMPQAALSQNDSLYIPFSVLANGLGLTVSYDQKGFLLKEGVSEIAK